MMTRSFSMINNLGASLNLNDAEGVYFHAVNGLGFSRTQSYRNVGNRWQLVSDDLDQQVVSGELQIVNPLQYRTIMSFLSETPLTLICTVNGTEYRRSVMCRLIERGEDRTYRLHSVGIEFPCLTPWYRIIPNTTPARGLQSNGWHWGITFPVTWASAQSNTVTINSDSTIASPCRLTIYGEIVNPTWLHYVNGELYETGSVDCTVASGNYLIIDNSSDPYEMCVYDGAGNLIQDVYPLSDFTTTQFITLQKGQNQIVITSEGASEVTVKAEGYLYYGTV